MKDQQVQKHKARSRLEYLLSVFNNLREFDRRHYVWIVPSDWIKTFLASEYPNVKLDKKNVKKIGFNGMILISSAKVTEPFLHSLRNEKIFKTRTK